LLTNIVKEKHMQKRMFVIFVLMLTAVTPAAQSKKPKPGFNLFSKEQDVQLGKESAAEVEKKMKVVDNPELQAYIGTVGKKLTSSADAGEFPYSFKVVVDKSINAFALPGGPMYIHTGLLAAADNESQMAGVMAHEVSHVALRHGTNQASKQQMLQLPAMLMGQATGSGGLLGTLSQLGINLGANSVLLKFSRSAETEADLLGTRLMHNAGYDPAELANFFRKLEAEGGNQNKLVEMFMASHPNPGNRVQAVQKEAKSLPSRTYNGETGQFRSMQALVAKVAGKQN
jgi:predicted Zn-dependent protease